MKNTNSNQNPLRATSTIVRRVALAVATGAAATGLVAVAAYAAVSQVIGVGTLAHFDLLGGPATITMRTLTIAPGEVLGWHYHPGIGAYTIVTAGTLTVEDGCGGETVYTAGQAFVEPPLRVHRGKNLTTNPVVTAQTFVVPTGEQSSVGPGQRCGAPIEVAECKGDGWTAFNHPRSFASQGDCIEYVITNKLREHGLN